jgi:hypothetical protein
VIFLSAAAQTDTSAGLAASTCWHTTFVKHLSCRQGHSRGLDCRDQGSLPQGLNVGGVLLFRLRRGQDSPDPQGCTTSALVVSASRALLADALCLQPHGHLVSTEEHVKQSFSCTKDVEGLVLHISTDVGLQGPFCLNSIPTVTLLFQDWCCHKAPAASRIWCASCL